MMHRQSRGQAEVNYVSQARNCKFFRIGKTLSTVCRILNDSMAKQIKCDKIQHIENNFFF